jgi:hypothetical protein
MRAVPNIECKGRGVNVQITKGVNTIHMLPCDKDS